MLNFSNLIYIYSSVIYIVSNTNIVYSSDTSSMVYLDSGAVVE